MKLTSDIPNISTIMSKFRIGEATSPKYSDKINNRTLVYTIRYYYNANPKGLTGFNKTNFVEEVMKFYSPTRTLFVLFLG